MDGFIILLSSAYIMSVVEEEPVAYDVPAVAARRRTGSITDRDWA